jgi:hypothetical protein
MESAAGRGTRLIDSKLGNQMVSQQAYVFAHEGHPNVAALLELVQAQLLNLRNTNTERRHSQRQAALNLETCTTPKQRDKPKQTLQPWRRKWSATRCCALASSGSTWMRVHTAE